MERFSFAKKVVSVRAACNPKTNLNYAGEENVLLSFGLKSGESGVTLVRKSPKSLNSKKSLAQPSNLLSLSERKIWKAFDTSD